MSTAIDAAVDLLYREASHLDTQRWDDWLELFTEDCEYWLPAWKGEHQMTADPRREVSLIYYSSRAGLADRVWRVRQGNSAASAVLPRTHHALSNIRMASADGEGPLLLESLWTVHQFLVRESAVEVFFGRYEHTLVNRDGALRIAKKKIVLLNDYLPAKIDFYSL